ncbi:retrotransposon protein, putative, ty1-copia subclass [Tanacetum coccineum]
MHNMGKKIGELHALLIEYEKGLPKKAATPQVMAIQGGRIQKANKKLLNAKGKEHPAKDDTCHHYKEVGHYKRNCPAYLVELIKKKKQVGTASSSGIYTIGLFSFPNKSWVYDTGCGTHICNIKQGLRWKRKLKQGALYLCVGNGVHAQVEAIGSDDLVLPNGLVICLHNCHYAPTITRGVVSVSRFVDNGFIQCFANYEISVSKNNVLYFNVVLSDGIYEIDILNLVPNVNSIYNDSYFITFTNDYSQYGYVYLLKHKHEVFETFKVFKNEVKNQLRKTIKALRSDRGGEYIS